MIKSWKGGESFQLHNTCVHINCKLLKSRSSSRTPTDRPRTKSFMRYKIFIIQQNSTRTRKEKKYIKIKKSVLTLVEISWKKKKKKLCIQVISSCTYFPEIFTRSLNKFRGLLNFEGWLRVKRKTEGVKGVEGKPFSSVVRDIIILATLFTRELCTIFLYNFHLENGRRTLFIRDK